MSKTAWGVVVLIILTLSLLSTRNAAATRRDPYLQKSLNISVFFRFNKSKNSSDGSDNEQERTSFMQRYTLDALGNIGARWIMIYNTGLTFARSTTTSQNDDTSSTTHTWNYYLTTTLLPLSNIPLTLFMNTTRNVQFEKDKKETDSTSTSFHYGLKWRGKFRVLPNTFFQIDKVHNKARSLDTLDSTYTLNFTKKYGPTDNQWDNEYSHSENTISDTSNKQLSTNFRNSTNISRATRLNIGAAASTSDSSEGNSTSVVGMNSTLSSHPNKEFSHTHNYSFYSFTTDGQSKIDNEMHSYTGDMSYQISDRVSTSAAVGVTVTSDDSETSYRDTNSLSMSSTTSYRATDHLSLAESVSYTTSTSTSEDVSNSTLDDTTQLQINSTANYGNNYRWASFNASGSAGYSEFTSNQFGTSNGLTTSASTALSSISIIPLITAGTAANIARTRSQSNGEGTSSLGYNFNASNKVLQKYVGLSGAYSYSSSKSFAATTETTMIKYNYSVSTSYFKTVPIRYTFSHTKSFDFFEGYSTETSTRFSTSHKRNILGGEFSIEYSRTTEDGTFKEGEQQSENQTVSASYSRSLTRNAYWQSGFTWTHEDVNDFVRQNFLLSNAVVYQLRSWLLNLEHTYIRRMDFNFNTTQTLLMLSATRSIGIVWH